MDTLKHLLAQKSKELESLPKPASVRLMRVLYRICLLMALLLLGFGIPGCVIDSGEGAWPVWTWMFWSGLLLEILAVMFGAQIEKLAKRDKSPEALRLESEISTLRGKLRSISSNKKELAKVETELVALNPDRFGCKSTDELTKLRDSRHELIGRIMGEPST